MSAESRGQDPVRRGCVFLQSDTASMALLPVPRLGALVHLGLPAQFCMAHLFPEHFSLKTASFCYRPVPQSGSPRAFSPVREDKYSLAVSTACAVPLGFLLVVTRGLPARKGLIGNVTHQSSSLSSQQPPKECHPKSRALPFAPGPSSDRAGLHNSRPTAG